MHLAIVDDDAVEDTLIEVLGASGHKIDQKHRGADLLLSHHDYDAVILDLGLPDMDGLEVLRRLRQVSSVPVVILTKLSDERTVVRGLRAGADDYIVKPARVNELVARLDTVTRRAATPALSLPSVVVTRDVRVDLAARRVTVAGQPISLTRTEFSLVQVLVEHAGAAVSREQLLDLVWGDAFLAASRCLDVHIATLRAKLDRPGLVSTLRGYGYRWEL